MAQTEVRPATLDDTFAISELAQSRIVAWQRIDESGAVRDIPYTSLSIYERWLHGGPWMSVETGALQLSHLLRRGGLALVAVQDGRIIGYAEAHTGHEPDPFGFHLHLARLEIHDGYEDAGADDAIITAVVEGAQRLGVARITVNCPTSDTETAAFYALHKFKIIASMRRMSLSARTGQVFYRASDHEEDDHTVIDGWHLCIGRLGSARHQWVTHWPRTWDAMPEMLARRTHRMTFNAAGNDAFVLVRQQIYAPRSADVACWTPKPPSGQLITAIRDWAHREGYRTLVLPTLDNYVNALGLDAEPDGYREDIYSFRLS